MGYIFHNRMQSPVLDKGVQLVLEVFDLLSREARYGRRCANTLPRRLVASLAIFDLGLKVLRRNSCRALVLRAARRGKNDGQDCRLQC